MPVKLVITVILIISLVSACSKSGNTPSNAITGKWIFRGQAMQSFAYPSVLTGNSNLLSASNYHLDYDSISLICNANGTYTFTNLRVPVDNGSFTMVQDSFLVIHPDTSGLIKFCYPGNSGITFTTTTPGQPLPAPPAPYAGFTFSSDTLLYKKPDADSLVFATYQISKLTTPSSLTKDTLAFNTTYTYFIKK